MVEIASIIQVVAWGTRLSLGLYDFAISTPSATREANKIAKSVSLFTLMLKQVGTLLKEDATTPSAEAYETVQDITLLAQEAFAAVEEVIPTHPKSNASVDTNEPAPSPRRKWDLVSKTKLQYLLAYIDSLNSTLSVMLQAFYTVRVIAWSRSRHDRVPASAADAVANERAQLEVLVIEQQLLLFDVCDAHSEYRRSCDFSGSPSSSGYSDQRDFATKDKTPSPSTLDKYKDTSIKDAKPRKSITESSALVRGISSQYSGEILARWTKLNDIERRLSVTDEEPDAFKQLHLKLQRRDSYQPRVDSGSDAENSPRFPRAHSELVMSPKPQRPPSVHQMGAMERNALPIPIQGNQNLRLAAPFSPGGTYASLSPSNTYVPGGASPARSVNSVNSGYFPSSPRTSTAALPPTQASSQGSGPLESRERAPSNGLGIPWRLWLLSNRWDFVDDQVVNTNSQVPLDKAYTERNGWTEIMQTWVRREAIEEARYSFNQVQKEMPDGNRTRFETCFCIGKPLTYPDVRRLVDRSIELFRQNQQPARLSSETSDGRSISSAASSSHRREREKKSSRRRSRTRDDHNYSTTSDSEADARPPARRTNSYHGSSSRRKKESGKSGSSGAFGTLAKYGGLATLLEGLPEILKGI